ncbi:MAG TPA: hypothetical protein V6C81_21060 [Planktothrix sp.]
MDLELFKPAPTDRSESMQDLRLGRLLITMHLIKEEHLEKALSISEQTRLPMGKILVMTEALSDETLKSVVEAQWMLRDKILTFDEAKEAISIAKRNGWTLADAMIVMGCQAYQTKGTRLGELLIASEVLSADDITATLNAASASGLPLGRVLFLLDRLPEEVLGSALKLQHDLRLGKMEGGEAVQELRRAKVRVPSLLPCAARLGELLVSAGLLKEAEVDVAVGMSQANSKMFGELLSEFGWVSPDVVEAAVELQKLIRLHRISVNDACSVIKTLDDGKVPLQTAMNKCGLMPSTVEKNLSLYELLRLNGYMNGAKLQSVIKRILADQALSSQVISKAQKLSAKKPQDLKDAIKVVVDDSIVLAEVLKDTDKENMKLIDMARTLQEQVRSGDLKLDYALVRLACFQTGTANGAEGNGK